MSPNFRSRQIGNVEVVNVEQAISKTFIPMLVFIHGWWGSTKLFESWMLECAESDVSACAVTQPTGRLTTFADYVKDIVTVIEILSKVRPIILVGHSFGGLIAQKVAADHPELVTAVVLVSSAPPKGIRYMPPFWFKLRYVEAVLFQDTWNIGKADAMKYVLNAFDKDEAEQLFAEFRPESGRVLWEVAKGIPVGPIQCPVLVISGQHDRILPMSVQMKICGKYRSDYCPFSVGHLVPVEDTDFRVLRFIIGWARFSPKRVEKKVKVFA